MENKEQRIKDALQEAADSFWATVAESFPEAEHGDFPPDMDLDLTQIMEKSIRVWLEFNVPTDNGE